MAAYGVSHHPQAVSPCQFTEILDGRAGGFLLFGLPQV